MTNELKIVRSRHDSDRAALRKIRARWIRLTWVLVKKPINKAQLDEMARRAKAIGIYAKGTSDRDVAFAIVHGWRRLVLGPYWPRGRQWIEDNKLGFIYREYR